MVNLSCILCVLSGSSRSQQDNAYNRISEEGFGLQHVQLQIEC
jgi:hypothetical protein